MVEGESYRHSWHANATVIGLNVVPQTDRYPAESGPAGTLVVLRPPSYRSGGRNLPSSQQLRNTIFRGSSIS